MDLVGVGQGVAGHVQGQQVGLVPHDVALELGVGGLAGLLVGLGTGRVQPLVDLGVVVAAAGDRALGGVGVVQQVQGGGHVRGVVGVVEDLVVVGLGPLRLGALVDRLEDVLDAHVLLHLVGDGQVEGVAGVAHVDGTGDQAHREALAVLGAVALGVPARPARLVQQGVRGVDVEGDRGALQGGVVEGRDRGDRRPGPLGGGVVDRVDEGVEVDGLLEGPAHPDVVEGGLGDVEVQGVGGARVEDLLVGEAADSVKSRDVLRGDPVDDVDLAGLEGADPGRGLRQEGDLDGVEVGGALPAGEVLGRPGVVLAPGEGQGGALLVVGDGEGPDAGDAGPARLEVSRAQGRRAQRGGAHGGQVGQEEVVGLGQGEDDGPLVGGLPGREAGPPHPVGGRVVLLGELLEVLHDRVGGQRLAVGEGDALPEDQGEGQPVLAELVGLGEPGVVDAVGVPVEVGVEGVSQQRGDGVLAGELRVEGGRLGLEAEAQGATVDGLAAGAAGAGGQARGGGSGGGRQAGEEEAAVDHGILLGSGARSAGSVRGSSGRAGGPEARGIASGSPSSRV